MITNILKQQIRELIELCDHRMKLVRQDEHEIIKLKLALAELKSLGIE